MLFAAGMALAYVVLAKGLKILIEQAGSGTRRELTVNEYLSFVTLMLVVFGAAFEAAVAGRDGEPGRRAAGRC